MHFAAVDPRRGVGINEVASRGPALASHGRDGASPCGLYSTRPTRQRHHILGHEPWGSGSRLRRMEDAEPSEQELGMHVETEDPVNIFHSIKPLDTAANSFYARRMKQAI
jgi:hypothetical protein